MKIDNLINRSKEEIIEVFNNSFADYLVPMQLNAEQFDLKCKTDQVDLNYSLGIEDKGRLVGFILNGLGNINDKLVLYNAGTGVIPEYRGKGIVKQLYDYLIPKLTNIDYMSLEVISDNIPAIKSYEKVGFDIYRHLHCYKGSLSLLNTIPEVDILVSDNYDWERFKFFWDWQPSWSNSISALNLLKSTNKLIVAQQDQKVIAYLIYNPLTKRIQQFSVDKTQRNKGIGSALLAYLAEHFDKQVHIINVDARSDESNEFLKKNGFEKFISQYEMIMPLL
ncbi:GNAT family N-acetyltransferase [Pedobacter nyackensis]|uniref:Ribosomal protein S18 acetylase RimI n=1 Tax=Pedobacter nyackensis TaxID=475255 RepID=A0A1W2EJF6_9SPHI|nr:GNAT family N-acetyltransferase [Pedobacter nyackensis]SMD09268.1 Ribosomal protein S18 acetylase RimI [Pedobacter nyackensis]